VRAGDHAWLVRRREGTRKARSLALLTGGTSRCRGALGAGPDRHGRDLPRTCLPKQDWLAQRDLMGVHWPVWGKRVLEYDQGPEHEAKAKGIQRGVGCMTSSGKCAPKVTRNTMARSSV
jgi:hypothetical protein